MNWISVKDRLPEYNQIVNVKYEFIESIDVTSAILKRTDVNGHHWYYLNDEGGINKTHLITHWMPLPEPPNN